MSGLFLARYLFLAALAVVIAAFLWAGRETEHQDDGPS